MITSSSKVGQYSKNEIVQQLLTDSATQITVVMVRAIIASVDGERKFKSLRRDLPFDILKKRISESDGKTQMVYKKLFQMTLEHIEKNAPELKSIFDIIDKDLDPDHPASYFLRAFVLSGTELAVERIKEECPDTLKNPEIWQ